MSTPRTMHDLKPLKTGFLSWLHERGAVTHEPTNAYEVLRFDAAQGVGIVYRKKSSLLTWTDAAVEAWNAFRGGSTSWRPAQKTDRRSTRDARRRRAVLRCLFKRDGAACIYCGAELTEETATVEHVVPLGMGGPDRLINMALACRECNHGLGCLPAAKKITYALARRG